MVTQASRALIQLVNQARVALGLPRLQRLADWDTCYSTPPHLRRRVRWPWDASGVYIEELAPGGLTSGAYFEDSCPIALAFPVAMPGENPVWIDTAPDALWTQAEMEAEWEEDLSVWAIRLPSAAMVQAVAAAWGMPWTREFCDLAEDHVHDAGAPCADHYVRIPDLIGRWLTKHSAREYDVATRPSMGVSGS